MKILITGASQGLGKSIAFKFAQSGHQLVLIARQAEKLAAICNELSAYAKVEYIAADLSETDKISAILAPHMGENSPDVLINNLGVYREGVASELSFEKLEAQLKVNLYAAIGISNCMLPFFKARGNGLIVNVGSLASHAAISKAAAYSISKHALKGWSDALREEVREFGIKVSSIYPSSINTSSWDGIKGIDFNKMVQKEDVANLIAAIVSMSDATLIEEIRLSPLQNFLLE